MVRVALLCVLVIASLLFPALPAAADPALEVVADGLTRPVFATSPPGDPRVFVVE